MAAQADLLAQANEEWPSIGDPSIMMKIVLGANEPIAMIEAAEQKENTNGDDNDGKRSHLTRHRRTFVFEDEQLFV